MFCILIYDVDTKDKEDERRLLKINEICKKYLDHVEFSVFEGKINKKNLKNLIRELRSVMDESRDSVIIYLFRSKDDIKEFVKVNINVERNVL